jgi:hypothetical protein
VRSTGVAFEVALTRSRHAARLSALSAAIPAAGLALAGWQLLAGPTLVAADPPALRAVLAAMVVVSAAVLACWALRAARCGCPDGGARKDAAAESPGGFLVVDERGVASLRPPDGQPQRPYLLRTSCALPGLILLVLAPDPGNSPRTRQSWATLRLGRDTMTDEHWRRLNVWLRWMERGRHDLPASRPERT